jgi:molybdenum cofactor biosynthesis protein B
MKVNIALLTVTDTRTIDNDKSGAILVKKIDEANHNLIDRKICKDNKDDIVVILKDWLNNNQVDVIITTGGTGLTGRDITPEALDEIADKYIPGFGEIFRYLSYKTIGTSTIQSRACAVLAKGKYVFALPGSSGGVTDAWEGILKHQLDVNHKPCNFVELIPKIKRKIIISGTFLSTQSRAYHKHVLLRQGLKYLYLFFQLLLDTI